MMGQLPTVIHSLAGLDLQPDDLMARAAVRRQLRAWSVEEETAFTAELVAGELVANAVRYGGPPFQLRLIRDRSLTREVSDTSSSTPHRQARPQLGHNMTEAALRGTRNAPCAIAGHFCNARALPARKSPRRSSVSVLVHAQSGTAEAALC
ncbi:hypothetical protein ABB07_36915 [Streptomyces incarnatus]|uniref:Histidine kinase/HSP90-like ATPase domain-containing protein n=1 Tax=Streptomyces incarnatus TaxID=665007 RepID=A0ABN4GRD4_9ACTN|nr:hypothetical protein ABB07_36915 [Streptomyces incarnatus]